ncbi:MAG: hypothetical protein WA718_20260 [Terriglobales bacterium]
MTRSLQPLSEFVGAGEHTSRASAGIAANGQISLLLPTTNGSLVAPKKAAISFDRFPRVIRVRDRAQGVPRTADVQHVSW